MTCRIHGIEYDTYCMLCASEGRRITSVGKGLCPVPDCGRARIESHVNCAVHDTELNKTVYLGLEAISEQTPYRLGSRLREHMDDVLDHLWSRLDVEDVKAIEAHREALASGKAKR